MRPSRAGDAADDTDLRGVRAGEPLLVERRVILDGQGRRIEATESRYPGGRDALEVWFDVERSAGADGA